MFNSDSQTLKVSVAEDIKLADVPPGGGPAAQMTSEEREKHEKYTLELTRLMGRYVTPHNKKSRWVTQEDITRVLHDAQDMLAMCGLPHGKHNGALAIAHSQIEDQDPLRFFVLPNGMVVINPVITNHTKFGQGKEEGCMSFPLESIKKDVLRYNKVEATYQTLRQIDGEETPALTGPVSESLNGRGAQIFQHECGHLNGCNVYDTDYSPIKSIYMGDGVPADHPEWIPS